MVVVFLRFAGRWRPISGLVWLALIIGWPVVPSGFARPLPAPFDASYLVESWTPDEGLPDDSVRSIVQTPDQYLWMATAKGLVRYFGFWDGSKWASAPAESHFSGEPVGLAPAKAGGFWLVASNVVRRIQNGQPQEEWRLSQPVTPFWRLLEDRQGRLWLPSTADGLFRIDPGGQVELMQHSERFPYEGRIRCVWEDH